MKRHTKRVVATVESATDEDGVEFDVRATRSIILRFPKGQYGYGGYIDWTKTLTPDEALAIGRELIDAAECVTAAEHVE